MYVKLLQMPVVAALYRCALRARNIRCDQLMVEIRHSNRTFFEKPIPETSCVLCGQCVGVCPTGALKPKREHLLEQGDHLPGDQRHVTWSKKGKMIQGSLSDCTLVLPV
jgi:ferredoxin